MMQTAAMILVAFAKRFSLLVSVAFLSITVSGCARLSSSAGGSGNSNGSNQSGYILLTGNWVLTASPTTGQAPFTNLSGFINESGTDPGINDFTTAALQVGSSICYTNSVDIPFEGAVLGTSVYLASFPVNGQVVSITAQKDMSATHLTGTYNVAGGCSDGDSGQLQGTLYAPLNGTYTGNLSGFGGTVQLQLVQSGEGTGEGLSFLYGTASFAGITCFSSGSVMTSKSYAVGSSLQIYIVTDEQQGSTVVMSGISDPTGKSFIMQSVLIEGGGCAAVTHNVSFS